MSVLTQTAPPLAPISEFPPPGQGQRVVLPHVAWQDYIAIGNALRDRPALRLTYDRGTLEIMTTSSEHEWYKMRFGRLLETIAEEYDRPIDPLGNMTFQREDLDRGFEPDQCYWISHESVMRAQLHYDPQRDPPPDLIVEIDVTRSALNRMALFAAYGVPEVWRYDGTTIYVHLLQPDRTYAAAERSPTFPAIPVAEIARFLVPDPDQDYLSVVRAFRTWVRERLA